MKSLQSYSNEVLLQETKNLVAMERQTTLQLIECLAEVETRMLFAELGYSSLWQFCIQYLGLSEGASQRRISALRLSRQIPEVKEAISEGKLSLSNASKLESFFSNEKREGRPQSIQQKKSILEEVQGMSQSECEKKLFQISPQFEVRQKEILKPISGDQNLLKLVLDSKVIEQLNLLKDRLAHKMPNASYAELVQFLVEDKILQIEKKMALKETPRVAVKPKSKETEITIAAKVGKEKFHSPLAPSQRKAIPIQVCRALWKRSGGKCEYRAPDGRRCSSAHFLEIDHIQSWALGGTDDLSNLRHACRAHNGFLAKKTFGSKWMGKFMHRL